MSGEVQPVTTTTFTPAERCDRCGAQAHASAALPSGRLLFCAHHYREHWEALLLADADIIHDLGPELTTTP
jgi:hypothetical protein